MSKGVLDKYIKTIKNTDTKEYLESNLDSVIAMSKKNKSLFYDYLIKNKNFFYNSKTRTYKKNDNNMTITFSKDNKKINQDIHLGSNNKIKILNKSQSGGVGYTYQVGLNPIAGKPVISPYLECCAPIFNGQLLQGGGKKIKQKGGRLNTAYYLDVAAPHFNVVPQYRQYVDTICK